MSGDGAFEKLVELHYAALYRFALSLTHSESEACDLTQQTFYVWAEKGRQLRDESKVKSWLFTTLHRQYLGRQRKIVRFPETELSLAEPLLPEVSATGARTADRSAALDALAKLDPQFRAALSLFYLEDYTHPEIAAILSIPLGTVKSRISRGVAQLQNLFREPGSMAGRSE
jgi:RNA polymerase sigma-70 factor, ECF subfamily